MRLSTSTPLAQAYTPGADATHVRNPLTPEPATQAAWVAYASALLPPSDSFGRIYDGALELAETYIARGIKAPARRATRAEIEAVLPVAEERDDQQYQSIESARNATTFQFAAPPLTVEFLAVLAAAASAPTSTPTPTPTPAPEPVRPAPAGPSVEDLNRQQTVQSLQSHLAACQRLLGQL